LTELSTASGNDGIGSTDKPKENTKKSHQNI
jgi:hypothetical protein